MQRMFEPFFTTKDPARARASGCPPCTASCSSCRDRFALAARSEWAPSSKSTCPSVSVGLPVMRRERGCRSVRGGRETMLLVEDEAQVRKLVLEVLQGRGYRVLPAVGRRPKRIALEEKYPGRIDLLITDLIMPGMSGRELAQHVTGTRPGAKVLFISGYTDDALLRARRDRAGHLVPAKAVRARGLAAAGARDCSTTNRARRLVRIPKRPDITGQFFGLRGAVARLPCLDRDD